MAPQTQDIVGGRGEPSGGAPKRPRKRAKSQPYKPVHLNMLPMMALFTVVLCALLKDYSSDPVQIQPTPDTRLPHSNTKLPPIKAVQVVISRSSILVDETKVADVEAGRVKPIYKKNNDPKSMFIVPLYELLKKKADQEKLIAKYNKKRKELQFKGLLTVVADK
ncbi:MAG: hypothetical protein D6806_00790, partial [Deltaproteobacteria bacterium]